MVYKYSKTSAGKLESANLSDSMMIYDSALCPGLPGRLSGLSAMHSKSTFCVAFVWARREINNPSWRFPAWAVLSFIVLVPGAFVAMIVCKLRHVQRVLHADTGKDPTKLAFDLMTLGLATEEDRNMLRRYIDAQLQVWLGRYAILMHSLLKPGEDKTSIYSEGDA